MGTQTAGWKVKTPEWEASLQSCLKPVCSWFQVSMKGGITELQLSGRHLRLFKLVSPRVLGHLIDAV